MPVLKDLDLTGARPQRCICLGKERREAFLAQLKADSAFLDRMQIMDYSLLLGVHFLQRSGMDGLASSSATSGLTTPDGGTARPHPSNPPAGGGGGAGRGPLRNFAEAEDDRAAGGATRLGELLQPQLTEQISKLKGIGQQTK